MNRAGRLVHRGQVVAPDGTVEGDLPPTRTLGFRWSAFNNLFVSKDKLAVDEWRKLRATDEDDEERKLCQYNWCLPYRPPITDLANLKVEEICKRTGNSPRGVIPAHTRLETVFVDVGLHLLHWMLVSWADGFSGVVVDYGTLDVHSREHGTERGVTLALRHLRDAMVEPGWPVGKADGPRRSPAQVWVDSGWQGRKEDPDFVYDFCLESSQGSPDRHRYRPSKGFGFGQYAGGEYRKPLKLDQHVAHIGDHYHIVKLQRRGRVIFLVEFSADHWKSFFHARLATPTAAAGALTLYAAEPVQHLTLGRQVTAEKVVEEFMPGKGLVRKWVHPTNRPNHLGDCGAGACAAADFAGIRLELGATAKAPRPAKAPPPPVETLKTPDGRPFLATQR